MGSDTPTPLELLERARDCRSSGLLAEGKRLASLAAGAAQDPESVLEAEYLLCYFDYRLGNFASLLERSECLLPRMGGSEHPGNRVDLLKWMALAGCETGQLEMAWMASREACELASHSQDAASMAHAMAAFAACFERMGDPWQAERILLDALALAHKGGKAHVLGITLNNLSAVTIGAYYLLRDGEAIEEAKASAQRSKAYAAEALTHAADLDALWVKVYVEGNLGEAQLHLGEVDEAAERLNLALEAALAAKMTPMSWRIRASLGELELARHRPERARASQLALLSDMQGTDAKPTLYRVRHTLYRASRQMGDVDAAMTHLEAYLRLERERTRRQLRAQSELFVTRLEAETSRRQAEQARAEARIAIDRAQAFELDALSDELTGLANRRRVDQALPQILANAQARGTPLTVAMLDADDFKRVNDRFGHAVGDRVLVQLGQILREKTRHSDLVARIGGEEFLLVLNDAPPDQALEVCERIRQQVAETQWDKIDPGLSVTLSIGLAHAPPHDADDLFRRADAALYRAKTAGRNRLETD